MWNRFALTISDKLKSIEYLTSKFIISCSIFDILFSMFYSRFDWTLAASGNAYTVLFIYEG
ncbi:hypothetical protein D1AOALGA4SA_3340 [Olavius algarvensis Delta 1 endosymbiont]|nr:hypothetical protein D1AOALGA4SA_3340 [Olavius algarvensis Delta 1 endosymbiont]